MCSRSVLVRLVYPNAVPPAPRNSLKGDCMSDNPTDQASNTVKDPDDWTTGDETMTGAQASYLKTLC